MPSVTAPHRAVPPYHRKRVAPFGFLWITPYQPVPRAFRRVVASFFGTGIDHVNEYLVAPAATNSFGNDQGSYTLEGDIFPDQSFNYSFYGIDVTVVDTLG